MELNQRAAELAQQLSSQPDRFRVSTQTMPDGGTLLDVGVKATGGLNAGLQLANICLGGAAEVTLTSITNELPATLSVCVRSDHPLLACLAAQYAGWQVQVGEFFAMGSGPIRCVAAREPLFESLAYRETPSVAVGVLECDKLPTQEVYDYFAEKTGLPAANITLLAAKVSSQAGTVQVVARSLETALHKLHELGFDMARIVSGFGTAPLPPCGGKSLTAMGRTNDAVLYGGQVTLWVRGDDDSLAEIGPRVPSSSSADYGQPFREIFQACQGDFYKIDPHLFSPAQIIFINIETGRTFTFGTFAPDVLRQSFGW